MVIYLFIFNHRHVSICPTYRPNNIKTEKFFSMLLWVPRPYHVIKILFQGSCVCACVCAWVFVRARMCVFVQFIKKPALMASL